MGWQTQEIIKQALTREEKRDSYGRPTGKAKPRSDKKLTLPMAQVAKKVGELAQERAEQRIAGVLGDVDQIIDHRIDDIVMGALGFEKSFDEIRIKSSHDESSKPVFRRIQERAMAAFGPQLNGWVDELLEKPAVVKQVKAALQQSVTESVTRKLSEMVEAHANKVAERIMKKAAADLDKEIDVGKLAASSNVTEAAAAEMADAE